jgi:hypothetical protein
MSSWKDASVAASPRRQDLRAKAARKFKATNGYVSPEVFEAQQVA